MKSRNVFYKVLTVTLVALMAISCGTSTKKEQHGFDGFSTLQKENVLFHTASVDLNLQVIGRKTETGQLIIEVIHGPDEYKMEVVSIKRKDLDLNSTTEFGEEFMLVAGDNELILKVISGQGIEPTISSFVAQVNGNDFSVAETKYKEQLLQGNVKYEELSEIKVSSEAFVNTALFAIGEVNGEVWLNKFMDYWKDLKMALIHRNENGILSLLNENIKLFAMVENNSQNDFNGDDRLLAIDMFFMDKVGSCPGNYNFEEKFSEYISTKELSVKGNSAVLGELYFTVSKNEFRLIELEVKHPTLVESLIAKENYKKAFVKFKSVNWLADYTEIIFTEHKEDGVDFKFKLNNTFFDDENPYFVNKNLGTMDLPAFEFKDGIKDKEYAITYYNISSAENNEGLGDSVNKLLTLIEL